MEASLLGTFMIAVCSLVVVLESPLLPGHLLIPNATLRTAVLAAAIGSTAALLIHSPWGKRSGAHLNPAVTLAFFHLKRVQMWDAIFYASAQFVGATLGVFVVALTADKQFTDPPVLYATTVPGPAGDFVALIAEGTISFLLMLLILVFVGSHRLIRFTGSAVGLAIALFILLEAPLSGTSMNPARTVASAIPGMFLGHLWVYLLGPTIGMLAAAEVYRRRHRPQGLECAKLLHPGNVRCIHCGFVPQK
jgi:aquaporin Z